MLLRDRIVQIVHCYRETNQVANFMASYAASFNPGCHQICNAPQEVLTLLDDDIRGVAFNRLVSS